MINANLNARIGRLLQELPNEQLNLRQRSVALKQAVNGKLSSPRALLFAALLGFVMGVRRSCDDTSQVEHSVTWTDRARRLSVIILVVWFQRIKRSISVFTTA
ncbi:hypothetical protein [Pseudidiomarina sp.]|uniref:hypothetical protein n=1 Tax=Pseudidiomarina sp. TaxID=2081707 RepID=UPI003A96B1F7